MQVWAHADAHHKLSKYVAIYLKGKGMITAMISWNSIISVANVILCMIIICIDSCMHLNGFKE